MRLFSLHAQYWHPTNVLYEKLFRDKQKLRGGSFVNFHKKGKTANVICIRELYAVDINLINHY